MELQDVTRVMTKNIEDLIYRGDSLDRTHTPLSLHGHPISLFGSTCSDVYRDVDVIEFVTR